MRLVSEFDHGCEDTRLALFALLDGELLFGHELELHCELIVLADDVVAVALLFEVEVGWELVEAVVSELTSNEIVDRVD